MRYTRLRRQIESGTLIGTHGTPFAGGAEKIAKALKKRKISNPPAERKMNGDDEEMVDHKGKGVKRGASVVKNEESSEYETDFEESGDSDDEIPLAKLRWAKIGQGRDVADSDQTCGRGSIANDIGQMAGRAGMSLEIPRQWPSIEGTSSSALALPSIVGLNSVSERTWERETQGINQGYMPQAHSYDILYTTRRMN
jgi:hypothetical protein